MASNFLFWVNNFLQEDEETEMVLSFLECDISYQAFCHSVLPKMV